MGDCRWATAGYVLEDSTLGVSCKKRLLPGRLFRQSILFIIYEEECAILYDRSTHSPAKLVEQNTIAWKTVEVVKVIVSIERRVAQIFIQASVEFVIAGACNEFDLSAAFARAV